MADSKNDNEVVARPAGGGFDPLAGGKRLYNNSNTDSETHYRADASESKVEEAAIESRRLNARQEQPVNIGQVAQPASTSSNQTKAQQDKVATRRVERAYKDSAKSASK